MKEYHRTLVIEAHADDAAWIAGGTIPQLTRQGIPVDSFMATDSNWDENGAERAAEQRDMMKIFGMGRLHDVGNRYEIADGSLTMRDSGILLVQALLHVVDSAHTEGDPYDRFITFGPDGYSGHNDHKVMSEVARAVFGMRDSVRELWMAGMSPDQYDAFISDYAENDFYEPFVPVDISQYRPVIIPDTLPVKNAGIKAHQSQMARDGKLQVERNNALPPVEYFNVYRRI